MIGDLADIAIPFIGGILMAACPQFLLKRKGSESEIAKKKKKIRVMGYVLLGVAGLYFLLSLVKN